MPRTGFKERISHPSAQPLAHIDTSAPDIDNDEVNEDGLPESLIRLYQFAETNGDISHLLEDSVISRIGVDAVRQWQSDEGSREQWMQQAQRSLAVAAQESSDGEDGDKNYPFEGACLTLDTDVLTLDGWKPIADVNKKDFVYSRSPEGEAFYAPVTGTYRGCTNELVHFFGNNIDLLTTTNHKMVVVAKDNSTANKDLLKKYGKNHFFMEASDFLNHSRFYLRMPLTSTWQGEEVPTIYGMPAYDYLRILGWYISEGWYSQNSYIRISGNTGTKSVGSLYISQSPTGKPTHYNILEQDIVNSGIKYTVNGGNGFRLLSKSLNIAFAEELRKMGKSPVRRIPRHVLNLPSHLLKHLFDSLMLGDGHYDKNGYGTYTTTSFGLAGDIQELCQKIGLHAKIVNVGKHDCVIEGRNVTANHDCLRVFIHKRDKIDVAKLERKLIPQRAEVACIETAPYHTFYVRRNGICVWTGNSDIHYPILCTASQQFAARAYPALVRGDKVVGVKVFQPPAVQPSVQDQAKAGLHPTNQQEADQQNVQVQAAQAQVQQQDLQNLAKAARAERIKHYLNWLVFYKMANWEGETDALLHEAPVVGAGFKKVYFDENGLQSDYISSTRLTVNNNTKSIYRCPRITHDFDAYPYEIEAKQRRGEYRDIDIQIVNEDPEDPVLLIEQHRFEDLDEDGLVEPYIVTIYEKTKQVLRIEPAYTMDDIIINELENKVIKIERWLGYSEFFFLPDPKGRYYGIGFGRLLEQICDSIDTSINQLIDAGNAEIAGGGFIASGVRLQGSGQGGTIYQRPGEYQIVSASGQNLKEAIWERTLPHPSQITMQLLELLLGAAKDIASIKDVITGNTPATAPVGTTLALQDQALQVFTAIYQRMYRGFHREFYLMYKALKRWATDKEKFEYKELTGGDFDEDFSGDGTDIQPVADPAVVTKQQKISRIQTLIQLAESPIGQAAGMQMAGPAQEIAKEALNAMDWDRPERFIADVPPNPEVQAKVADIQASTAQKQAKAESDAAGAKLDGAKTLREVGLAAHDVHKLGKALAGLPAENPTVDEHGQLPGTTPQIQQAQAVNQGQ